MTSSDLLARRERLLGAAPLFYSEPIHIVRGEGVFLFDADGRRYVDMYNNVPCVGHANPWVVSALREQAATLNVHSRYLHEGVLEYAQRLVDRHAEGLESVVFTCTGTEANEVAIAMARAVTGGRGLICTDAAYHGNSAEVGKLTRVGSSDIGHPEIQAIPFPQKFRPLEEGADDEQLCDLYVAQIRVAIESFINRGVAFAGLVICPILANEGLPDIPAGFMRRAADLVRQTGGLVIVDEVQAGFCRTGSWWGYELMDFVPDIVTMGKPMGNGLPLAGVVASHEHVEAFRKAHRYFNTFAASPLQAAVGSAVLDVLEDRKLDSQAADVGGYLRDRLAERLGRCDRMGDVRARGLFLGIEWVKGASGGDPREPDREEAIACVDALKEKGFLISNAGAHGNVLKLRPPLVYERQHADMFLEAFDEMLAERYGAG